MDDDPSKRNDPVRWSNKGVLDSYYEPYQPILESQRQLNRKGYSLLKHVMAKTLKRVRNDGTDAGEEGKDTSKVKQSK